MVFVNDQRSIQVLDNKQNGELVAFTGSKKVAAYGLISLPGKIWTALQDVL